MSRTGHASSSGVRSYKRITKNLQEKMSKVLNSACGAANNVIEKAMVKYAESESKTELTTYLEDNMEMASRTELTTSGSDKEIRESKISFAGATNFTVNFNCKTF